MNLELKVTREQLNQLKNIDRTLDEVIFIKDKKRLSFLQSDRAMVCVVDFSIDKKEFEKFSDDKIEAPLNLENLIKSLKVNEVNRLVFEDNKLIVSNSFDYELPILDKDKDDIPPLEDLKYVEGSIFRLDYNTVRDLMKEFNKISDDVVIRTDKTKKVVFETTSDVHKIKKEFELDKEDYKQLKKVRVRFPLDYLRNMFYYSIKDLKVWFYVKTDFPTKIITENGSCKVMNVLAPRVTED